ncbi:hypothetical protein OIV83_003261 [Microbotryomycetes sp. JL201]|nr:hypothetical protein OIV83_003261 [Microbotryomycetes sp. JL201]
MSRRLAQTAANALAGNATASSASSCAAAATHGPLSRVAWTYLPRQLPYNLGLLLQEHIVQMRLDAKKKLAQHDWAAATSNPDPELGRLQTVADTDVLLLLQHTPVFTAGRREKDPVVAKQEADRLGKLGADYVSTMRGGQTTYHGPGQLVGYSLMDLGAAGLTTRCYVHHLETFLEKLTEALGVKPFPIEHTGVFTSPTSKIGSIGIHIRRRISLHGFSINIEQQTRKWFDAIVACGLQDVTSTSVEAVRRTGGDGLLPKAGETDVKVKDAVPVAVEEFGKQYGRDMVELTVGDEFADLREMIRAGVEGKLDPLQPK